MAGPDGAIAALRSTATWIDMTSSSPAVGRALLASARARGIGVLEALVERHRALLEVLADPGVERIHQRPLSRYGPAGGELLAVALLEEQAGVRLRHGPP
jgi:hypothetical protein